MHVVRHIYEDACSKTYMRMHVVRHIYEDACSSGETYLRDFRVICNLQELVIVSMNKFVVTLESCLQSRLVCKVDFSLQQVHSFYYE